MQVNRLFEIIYILLNKKIVTAGELAEHFGVSARTIYRDIDTLSLAGVPVYTEKGKGGGISLLPDYVLNKSILNEQEQNEILSALHGLSGVGGNGNACNNTEQVLQKLSAVFNKTAANWLEVDFSDWSYHDGDVFNDFKTAILERRIAEFDYYGAFSQSNPLGEMTHRRLEPIQLWFKSRSWYVKGYCLKRQDIRTFKLSRVRNLTITDKTFTERDLMSIAKSLDTEIIPTPCCDVKLRIMPEMTYRIYDEFSECVIEKQPDNSHIVTVAWPEDEWVYSTILSFGEYIEVMEPEHIKDIIKMKSQKIIEKYI